MDTSKNNNDFLKELKKLSNKPKSNADSFDKLKDISKEKIEVKPKEDVISKPKWVTDAKKEEDKIAQNVERKIITEAKWKHPTEDKHDLETMPKIKQETSLIKEPIKELTKPFLFKKPIEEKTKFSFENKKEVERTPDFEPFREVKKEELKAAEEKNNLDKAKQKSTMQFKWEKHNSIEEPTASDFNIKVEPTNFDWLKHEIIEEPQKEDFSPDLSGKLSTKDFTTPVTNEFEWEKHSTIEEPTPSDFSGSLTGVKEQIIGPKWKLPENKIPETEIAKPIEKLDPSPKTSGPKWIHKTKEVKKENLITKELEQKEVVTEIKKEEVIAGPKWKHHIENAQTKKDEEIKTKPLQKTTKTKEEPSGPKWIHDEKEESTDSKHDEKQHITESTSTPGLNTFVVSQKALDVLDHLKTPIDEMFKLIESYKTIDTGELARHTGLDYPQIEKILKLFEDYGFIELKYPARINSKPRVTLIKEVNSKTTEIPQGDTLDTYTIEVDKVPAEITIILSKEEGRPVYTIDLPAIGKYTQTFLGFIKDEIAENMPIELDEIMDPKKSKKLKLRFFEESQKHLKKYFPTSTKTVLDVLSGVILHEMYGLGVIEVVLGDDMLEEVAINSAKTPITIYHRIHGWLKTNLYPGTEEDIMNYSSQIGRKVGREINVLNPILDAHLLSGDRVNSTLFPISSEGNTLTIRRFARRPWTLIDFIGKAHTMTSEMAALLWLAMQYEMNIIISGGTASGKTSALNTLLSLVPSYHRLISIEDVREIVLPKYLEWNWIPMVTRSANPEGLGEVTMLDCMVSSLRMRPDRIIVGEIRRHKQAEVLMEAIETGHSIYSTIHANSAYQVLRRLSEPPMSIPIMQIELIDLIVVQYRDRKTNKRRTYEISEIEQTSTGQGLQVNTIYKWVPRTDSWEQLNRPTKILTMLNLHTGLTEDEIDKELAERAQILDWLKEENIAELNTIGFIVKLFYTDPTKVKQMAKKKIKQSQIEEMMK